MPLYEYRCIANDHQFDITQPVGDPPPACPVCGGATRKVYSSVGLVFKGSGFHVTDYRRPGGQGEEAARPGGTDGAKGDGKKTDAPAASESKASNTGGKEPAGGSKPAESGKS